MENKDIFDRILDLKIFDWKILNWSKKLFYKNKEVWVYLFFGGLTFIVAMGSFAFGLRFWDALIANIFSWIVAVIFAYVTNRTWVFHSQVKGIKNIFSEMISFMGGRLATLGMEEAVIWIGVDLLNVNEMIVKVVAQILVIIGNYVISKVFIFKDDK